MSVTPKLRGAGFFVGAFALSMAMAQRARANESNPCVTAFENSQQLRKEGRLLAASEALIVCSQPTCPEIISKDCTDWYTDVQTSLPSVTLNAKDDRGRMLSEVRVFMNGVLIAEKLDGRAIALDPGLHEFKFEAPDREPVLVKMLLSEGEKNKLVSAEFPSGESEPEPSAQAPSSPAPSPVLVAPPSRPPDAAYVVGGLGVLALGGGIALRLMSASEFSDLERDCKPTCTRDEVDPVELKHDVSTIALGVGGAAILTSAILFVIHGSSSRSSELSAIAIAPPAQGSGAVGSFTGRF